MPYTPTHRSSARQAAISRRIRKEQAKVAKEVAFFTEISVTYPDDFDGKIVGWRQALADNTDGASFMITGNPATAIEVQELVDCIQDAIATPQNVIRECREKLETLNRNQ